MKIFNVIVFDFNSKSFKGFNIIPYLVREYNEQKPKLKTFKEVKDFIISYSKYQWWCRCEYEIILQGWPFTNITEKWDVNRQVELNIDIITQVFINNIPELSKIINK